MIFGVETIKKIPEQFATFNVFGEPGGPHYGHYDLIGGRLVCARLMKTSSTYSFAHFWVTNQWTNVWGQKQKLAGIRPSVPLHYQPSKLSWYDLVSLRIYDVYQLIKEENPIKAVCNKAISMEMPSQCHSAWKLYAENHPFWQDEILWLFVGSVL